MRKLKVLLCRPGKNRMHIVNSVFDDDFRNSIYLLRVHCVVNYKLFVSWQTRMLDEKVLTCCYVAQAKTECTLLVQFFMTISEPSSGVLCMQCVCHECIWFLWLVRVFQSNFGNLTWIVGFRPTKFGEMNINTFSGQNSAKMSLKMVKVQNFVGWWSDFLPGATRSVRQSFQNHYCGYFVGWE